MPHTIEPALSSRAKCRGCDQPIAKDELRLGEREPNPYGEGEMTIWFHLLCGAFKRPEVMVEALQSAEADLPDPDSLQTIAEFGMAHERAPRVNGAQRAPTGRARCRACRELIEKESWRVALVYFEMSRFQPSGYIHANCAADYFGTTDLLDRIRHFSPELEQADLDEFQRAIAAK